MDGSDHLRFGRREVSVASANVTYVSGSPTHPYIKEKGETRRLWVAEPKLAYAGGHGLAR